jgi:hypothetical protein
MGRSRHLLWIWLYFGDRADQKELELQIAGGASEIAPRLSDFAWQVAFPANRVPEFSAFGWSLVQIVVIIKRIIGFDCSNMSAGLQYRTVDTPQR